MADATWTLDQALQQAIDHHRVGQLQPAEQLYRAILQVQPNHADANHNLGVLAVAVGKTAEALPFFKLALEANPNQTQFRFSYIEALIQANQLDTARSVLAQGQQRGLAGEQIESLASRLIVPIAVKTKPAKPVAGRNKKLLQPTKNDINQVVTLFNQGNSIKTEKQAREFIRRFPSHAFGWKILGSVLQNVGRLDESLAAKIKAVALSPNDAEAHYNLGNAFKARYELAQAEQYYRNAIGIKPDYAPPYYNLGLTLAEQNRWQAAVESYQQALQYNPNHVEAHSNLGDMFIEQHRLTEAEACYRTALRIDPQYMEAHNNLGILLKDQGRFSEAENFYRTAISLQPDARIHSNLLFTYTYDTERDAEFYLAEAKRYGQRVAEKVTQKFSTWQGEPQPTRLRVGFVSGDFWNHPVGYFLENLLAHLDSTKFELIAYPTIHRNDELTQRIKPYFSQWKSLVGLNDEAAASLIHADAVHILFDLSGHSAKNRLPAFAYKPAPLQISWLGYWATTGVAEIDAILVDETGVPPQNHWHFTEKVCYLPDTRLCFSAPKMDIDVSTLPALSSGYITVGCFQNLTKVTDAVLAVWGRIFTQLPSARLRLQSKQLSDAQFTVQFFSRLNAAGISANRVDTHGFSSREAYFSAHGQVDFILDSFPFTGGTTTCEALWMGVPTLTLAGNSLVENQGASLLAAAGLADWIAMDMKNYIEKAIVFASDVKQLAQLRSGLRERVLASPLFDGARFAKNFEHVLWQLWRDNQTLSGE